MHVVWPIAAVICTVAASMADDARLRSPWDSVKVVLSNAPYACPAPPPLVKTIDVQPYYTDKHASVIDPRKLAAFQKASESATQLGQFASAAADAYLGKGSRDAAVCVYTLLDAAAKAEHGLARCLFRRPTKLGVEWRWHRLLESARERRRSTGAGRQDSALVPDAGRARPGTSLTAKSGGSAPTTKTTISTGQAWQ